MDIAGQRLYNQGVSDNRFATPADAVSSLIAVQSQDYAGAKWSVGQRMQRATDADIDRAYNEGLILRTHVLRPTWHFVAPGDIRWLLELTSPRVHRLNAPYNRREGVDAKLLLRAHDVIAAALRGGKQLTRPQLGEALNHAGIETQGMRLMLIVMHAELEGLICSGAMRGKQHTYALLDERVPPTPRLERDEALAQLARRFFAGQGPVTVRDLAWWSGITLADARSALEAVKQDLDSVAVDDETYWFDASMTPAPDVAPAAYLLPEYDEALKGAVVRTPPPAVVKATFRGTYYRPVLIGTRSAGHWRRVMARDAVTIEVSPFAPLDASELALVEAAVQRYGAFVGLPARLEIQ